MSDIRLLSVQYSDSLQHVLPATLHTSLSTFPQVYPSNFTTTQPRFATKAVHPSCRHDLQTHATVQEITWSTSDSQLRDLRRALGMHNPSPQLA